MMRKACAFMMAVAFLLVFASVGLAQDKITALAQLDGKAVAVPKGTLADSFVLEKFPQAKIVRYDTTADCVAALHTGAVDAVAYDEPVLRGFLKDYADLSLLPELLRTDVYAFAVNPKRNDVAEKLNRILAAMRADGSLDKMLTRWFDANGPDAAMPAIKITAEDGKTLTFATFPQVAPFSFRNKNDEAVGIDVELATYVARDMNSALLIMDLPFDEMLKAVEDGRADLAGACITVTPERAKKVLFSDPYYTGGIAVLVKK